MHRRNQRIIKGIFAQGLSWTSTLGIRLLELPILIHFWGVEQYGEWLILFALPSLLSMSDFGFAGTAKREMAMLVTANKINEASEIYHSTTIFLLGISVVLIFISSIFLIFMFDPAWLNLSLQTSLSYRLTIIFLVSYIAVKMQLGMLEASLYSIGEYPRGVVYMSLIRLIEFAAFASVVFFGGGVVFASLTYLVISIILFSILLTFLMAQIDWIKPKFQFHGKIIKELSRPAIASLGFPFGNMMNVQGTRLVLGAVIGPVALAGFVAMRTLSVVGMRIVDMLSLVMEPEYAYAKGKNDISTLNKLVSISSQLAFWLGLTISLLLLLAGDDLMQYWTNGTIIIDDKIFTILVLAGFINTMWFNLLKVPYAINKHAMVALIFVVISAFILVLIILITKYFGMSGAANSLFLGEVLLALSIIPLSLKYVNMSVLNWISGVIKPPIWLLSSLRKYY